MAASLLYFWQPSPGVFRVVVGDDESEHAIDTTLDTLLDFDAFDQLVDAEGLRLDRNLRTRWQRTVESYL